MASAAASPVAVDLLDPRDFPDRDSLMNFLSTQAGWPTAKVAAVFELSDRQARRIVREGKPWEPAPRDEAAEPLTRAETEALLRDLASSPYTSPEERELVDAWVTSHAEANGIVELSRPRAKG